MARRRTPSEQIESKPRGAVFRASEVQRGYRLLLDRAKEEPVQILDSDGSVLGVELWEELTFTRRLRELAAKVSQFREVYREHRGEPASRWATMTPFPWVDALSEEEIEEFVHELVDLTLAAANRGELDELEGCISAFRATAATYRSPEILARMTERVDEKALVEVFPPSVYAAETVRKTSG